MKLRTILLTLALGLPSALWADGNHKITVERNSDFTGRGNAGETILTLKIAPTASAPSAYSPSRPGSIPIRM